MSKQTTEPGRLIAYGVIVLGALSWVVSFVLDIFTDRGIRPEVQGAMMLIVGWAVAIVAKGGGGHEEVKPDAETDSH